jgi:hypothetical protein
VETVLQTLKSFANDAESTEREADIEHFALQMALDYMRFN